MGRAPKQVNRKIKQLVAKKRRGSGYRKWLRYTSSARYGYDVQVSSSGDRKVRRGYRQGNSGSRKNF